MTRLTTTLPLLATLILSALQPFSLSALSQIIRWDPSGGSLAKGQVSQIQLVFENCQPQGNVAFPPVAGLELQHNGSRSQNFSSINGRNVQSVSFGFNARPTTDQRVTIPAFKINTDKGEVTVASVSFDVGAATVQGGQLTLDQVVGSKFIVPKTVWAGEVFPLTYRITALKRFLNSLGSEHPEWDSLPLNPEPWPKYQVADELKNGEPWINVTYATRAIARDPGEITLNTARHVVALNTGRRDSFFGFSQQEQFAITSDQPKITVKPLPAGAPAKFSGAVGQFKLESKIVPENAAVGEPITWTLTLAGQGNWPDIQSLPPRSVSKDFHAIQPQLKRTPQGENALYEFTLSEDVVLVPTKPGPYTLGPVEWSYFDPAQGRYVTITAPATRIDIAPAASAVAPIYTGTQTTAPDPTAAGLAAPPKTPAGLPGDPLESTSPAPIPLPRSSLILYLLAAGLWPLLLWLILALFRARRTDPNRPQREARARIQKTLAQIDETPAAERERIAALIQAWQRDTAILWKIPQVVPSASQFLKTRDTQAGAAWSALWSDSERALYRSGSPLPPDWSSRAHDALAARRVRSFNPFSLFAPRNLFPLAAALIVFLSAFQPFSPSAFSQTPAESYKSGDFKSAETAWRLRVADAPTDWTARHNLSLSLAQQDRWAEAGAQAFAAFVQHPNEPAVLRNVLLTLSRAGYTPSAVAEVTRPGPVREVALRFAPAQWQCALGCSVALAALGFAFVLFAVYGRRFRLALFIFAGAAFGFAALGATVSLLSLHAYGAAKDERAVIVWKAGSLRSIPTVADTTQKTTPLAAGTVAIVDKEFPGWVRLVFENGQTGWAPKEDTTALWK